MAYEIEKIKIEDEFKVCPVCGYEDGFHIMFKRINGNLKTLYICPSCHQVFEIDET